MSRPIDSGLADAAIAACGDASARALLDDWLSERDAPCALFLDVDGTLLDIVETPDAVLEGLRVLVVEHNPTNRMIATKLLENLGASVETAADGLLGVEAASRGAFDLILMDVQMPGIDGLEAARRIRALGGPVAAIPIVALTANVLAHQRQSYLEAGMDGVVGKPISPAALLAEIARLGETAPAEDARPGRSLSA